MSDLESRLRAQKTEKDNESARKDEAQRQWLESDKGKALTARLSAAKKQWVWIHSYAEQIVGVVRETTGYKLIVDKPSWDPRNSHIVHFSISDRLGERPASGGRLVLSFDSTKLRPRTPYGRVPLTYNYPTDPSQIINVKMTWSDPSKDDARTVTREVKIRLCDIDKLQIDGWIEWIITPKSSMCFVATAAMGDCDDAVVVSLSRFRDQYLSRSTAGRYVIRLYYCLGPIAARGITSCPRLRTIVRTGLVQPASSLASRLPNRNLVNSGTERMNGAVGRKKARVKDS